MKWPGPRVAAAAAAALLVAGGAALWALQQPFSPRPHETPTAVRQPENPLPPRPEARIVQVECRQGACNWARIVEIAPVASGRDGELRRLTYRPGSSMDDGSDPSADAGSGIDWAPSDRGDYAYCSTVRPAFAFPDDAGDAGALIVHHLDLFDLGGYQFASAKLYGLICHDLDAVVDAEPELRALGYRPGTRSEQTRAVSPESLLRR